MKKVFHRIFGVMFAFLMPVLTIPSSAMALTESQLNKFSQNEIFFYDPKSEKCGVSGGGNQNYAGAEVWSEAELDAIAENQPFYEEAAKEYDLPWQILAVVHSMETSLRRYNPGNGQGVYQLYSYTEGGTNQNRFEPADSISDEEFSRQTKLAAELIYNKAGNLEDEGSVKRLLFEYNGTAKKYIDKALAMGFTMEEAQNGEGSPYVMNRYDAARDPASAEMSPVWPGRYTGDHIYTEGSTSMVFGSFVRYVALAGNSFCSNAGGGIVETALLLSWPGHDHAKDDPKPEYVDAMKEVGTYNLPCNSSGCAPYGASCDVFVSTVMRYSGLDKDFPPEGPIVQEDHMRAHPEMYMRVEATDVSDLQAGDILVTTENGRHIYLFLGEIDGALMQASASFNDRTGEHFEGVYLSDGGTGGGTRHYNVYRRLN